MSENVNDDVQTVEEASPEVVEEVVEAVTVPVTKKSGRITKKQARLNAIEDYKNGIKNNDFNVYPLKNGSYRVIKRENVAVPIVNDDKPIVNETVVQQYTDHQFLINHILSLEREMEKMRGKHKKLKKSHKKLKNDVYEDSDPDYVRPIDLNTISAEIPISNTIVDETPKVGHSPDGRSPEPQPMVRNRPKRTSWRTMLM